uniref:Putative tail protein n=1 Tax=viral metagenome TaxID=1070528 RepID=A0A6M3JB04_9ZZZZ
MDCAVSGGYLLVAVDTKATKTVYWNGAALTVVDSGPGGFDVELTAPTFNTSAVNTSYQLRGNGTYQIAYRFYDSTRGIYSALSAPLVVRLDHYKTTKAVGTISFSSAGSGDGLIVAGDVFTINGRTYEYIDAGSDVTIAAASAATISAHATALADAINGDSSAEVTASAQAASVLLEAIARGTGGNAYTLSVTEVEPNTDDIAVSGSTLSGGGVVTADPETQVKVTIDFPANDAVVAGEDYSNEAGGGFANLFDTVDIFRTIDLGNTTATMGAIFYLEQTIAKTGNWATADDWDSLTADIGGLVDEALPFQTMYDPEKDIVVAPPQSGTIGRYSEITFMAQASSTNGGYDTLSSSPEHNSPEYFSTYNTRVGDPEDGRPLRFIPAGDSLFQLGYNAVIHIFKSGKLKPLQFSRLHKKRGIVGKEVAHSSGNSVFMISGLGLVILNASDGGMGNITAADRVIFDDWKSELSTIKSCYDSLMNASFFLNPTRAEMLVIWHSTQICSMIDGANFVGATSGPDIATGKNDRAFFVTATGLIVSPDKLETGSGTMWDLDSSLTLNGTATATSSSTLTDSGATLHADMVGAKLYMTSGDNAGDSREIATIDNSTKVFTFTSNFDNDITSGDNYAISPVPFSLRAWALQAEEVSRFNRWITSGVALKVRKLSGFGDNVNNKWRVGAYRNSGTSIESTVAYPTVDSNPADSAEGLNVEGIDIEPYIEQIASGVKFELTDTEFAASFTESRSVSATC